MNYQRKFPKFDEFVIVFLMFAMLILAGCAGKSVRADFPFNHPANPEALETQFTPPLNPFHTDMAVMKQAPEKDAMMKPKPDKDSGMQHMDHRMGTDKKSPSDSESKMKPEHTEGHNQHQEHSQ